MNKVCKQPDFILKKILSAKLTSTKILTSLIEELINKRKSKPKDDDDEG